MYIVAAILKGYELNAEDYMLKTLKSDLIVKKVKNKINHKKNQYLKSKARISEEAMKIDNSKPSSIKIFGNFVVNHLLIPFDQTPGGDFIECYNIDKDQKVFVIADVMGKQWGAWFHSFLFRKTFNFRFLSFCAEFFMHHNQIFLH